MMRIFSATFLAIAAASCAAPTPTPPPAEPVRAASLNNAQAILLASHNQERARFGSRPLVWDRHLAAGAQDWARYLASRGELVHSRHRDRPGQGENMWMGTRGFYSARSMVSYWASERRHFRPGSVGNFSRTGQFRDVGHYTQMVWPSTTRMGCAIASSEEWDVLVCRYSPAGNVSGVRIGP